MADFTSNLPEPTFLDSLNGKIFSDNINESITALRNIQLPKKADHLQFIENRVKDNRLRKTRGESIEGLHSQPIGLIQPPVFYRTQVFNNYLYQNKLNPDESIGVNKATGQPYKRLVSRNRAKVDSGFSIAWDHYPVPTSTTKEASDFIKHFPRKDLLERLESLFNGRPCWTRAALMNQFTPQEARFLLNQKLSVTVYSYTFHSGPFADTLCRIGWDPRLDSGNRIYQRIQTRILGINERRHRGLGGRASGVNAAARASTATPSTPAPRANSITRYFTPVNSTGNAPTTPEHNPMELNSESHIFDGKHTPEATNFQICDIHDEDCKKLIADEQGHNQTFDYVTGFFTTEQITRIRGVLKRKIIVLKEENRQLTEEELAQLLIPGAMQNDSDEETTQQTPLANLFCTPTLYTLIALQYAHHSQNKMEQNKTPAAPTTHLKSTRSSADDFATPKPQSSDSRQEHNPFEATIKERREKDRLEQNRELELSRTTTTTSVTSGTSTPSANSRTPFRQQSSKDTLGSKGLLTVKVMEARRLAVVDSTKAHSYVVVTFENNEFVSREPIGASEGVARGFPKKLESSLRRTPSSGARTPTTPDPTNRTNRASPPITGLLGQNGDSPVWKHQVTFDVSREDSPLEIAVYDRDHSTAAVAEALSPNKQTTDESLANLTIDPQPGEEDSAVHYIGYEGEKYVGSKEIRPHLSPGAEIDHWYELSRLGEDGREIVTGEIRLQILYERFANKHALNPKDFEFLRLIGRGTFGRVFQVRKKDTKRIYAMKVLSKKEIIAKKEVAHTIGERKILQVSLECPFLVGLKFSFQTEKELYFVTDYKSGGELFWHLQREGRFTEERARFYIAELVLALEHLHKYDIVYRDLKPENILLDATGHVALCDFGLSKPDLPADQLTSTFCGTTEYLAPEVLLNDDGYSMLVDFWSLGVLLFEMCCGWSPFYAEDTQQMYKNICFGKIRFPKGVIGDDGKQFVKGLLNRNPEHRLGSKRDAAELKEDPFFKSIDWNALANRQVTPPFKPLVESDESVANFDTEFTGADIREHGVPWDDDVASPDRVDKNGNDQDLKPALGSGHGTPSGEHKERSESQKEPRKSFDKHQERPHVSFDRPQSNEQSIPKENNNRNHDTFRGFTYTGEREGEWASLEQRRKAKMENESEEYAVGSDEEGA
ncbi:kinase-like protein [Wallemia mellicola]|nr:kinase-like protein [Wallemia mellicola]TIC13247.1 kinase-like protein [Wallemia mellicola]TIC14898.1 kinase-like protein [Wallemia mellicola]TIC19195.1 kinase-like protein [Wallemia mellicola]